MLTQSKILKVRRLDTKRAKSLVEYDGIVDDVKGKFTKVSMIPYYRTTGIIMRRPGGISIAGYCVESPREVLERVFPDYYVTRYMGYGLFGSSDFEPTTPMLGLGIDSITPVFGIEGRLENLLKLEELLKVKRDKPISKKDVKRIITNLEEEGDGFLSPGYKQHKHDKQEIIKFVQKYGE